MTKSEYHELVDYLGVQFTEIRGRLTGVEDRLTGVEGRLTRVEVLQEENRSLIQTVAEGVTAVDEKLDRFRVETDERFRELRSEVHALYGSR